MHRVCAAPRRALVALLLLLCVLHQARPAEAVLHRMWDGIEAAQTLFRTGVVALWGTAAVNLKSDAAKQFFRGLDDVHVCLTGDTALPLPPLTLGERIRSWIIPRYHSSLQLAREEALMRRRGSGWAGCVTGSVRSIAAGYIFVNDVIPMQLLSRIADPLEKVAGPLWHRVAITSRRGRDGGVHAIGNGVRKLIGWK